MLFVFTQSGFFVSYLTSAFRESWHTLQLSAGINFTELLNEALMAIDFRKQFTKKCIIFIIERGHCSMAEQVLPKHLIRVRFSLSALNMPSIRPMAYSLLLTIKGTFRQLRINSRKLSPLFIFCRSTHGKPNRVNRKAEDYQILYLRKLFYAPGFPGLSHLPDPVFCIFVFLTCCE